MTKKILTYLLTKSSSNPTPAAFSESIVDAFHDNSGDPDQINVECYLKNDRFIISASTNTDTGCVLRRPTFCPLKHMTTEQVAQLSPLTKQRGVNVGVAILLKSSDNLVLLTKRSQKMRTFPNVWVPPGGHIDIGESLKAAGLRELHEETGVTVKPVHNDNEAQILGLWESSFPPMLSIKKLPSRHHIVVYFTIEDERSAEEINATVQLDETEVEECGWICQHLAADIVSSDKQFGYVDKNAIAEICHKKYCCHISVDFCNFKALGASLKNGKTVIVPISISSMLNAYSHENAIERVSTGTKFALKLLLEKGFSSSKTDQRS